MSRADYKKGTVREYGFTDERIIQDFPIRGKAVYLHVRRRCGPNLAIDESSLSCGELYTFVTNRDAHGGKGALVAAIRGTKAETVIAVLEKIPLAKRKTVREITFDLSSSMMLIARRSFPKAIVTNDRFHVHKLYYDAIDDLRIALRWMARDIENYYCPLKHKGMSPTLYK